MLMNKVYLGKVRLVLANIFLLLASIAAALVAATSKDFSSQVTHPPLRPRLLFLSHYNFFIEEIAYFDINKALYYVPSLPSTR